MDHTPDANVPGGQASAQCRVCERRDGTRCAYVDGQARVCATDWCPDHVGMIDGRPYCRRHAGIVSALGYGSGEGHLPDVDNRAHSLAHWVGNDMDEGVRKLLDRVRGSNGDQKVVAEPIGYIFTVYRTHLWERSWKLADAAGLVLRVSIDVDEANDSEVRLRVGKRTIMSMVPPWIERRFAGPRFASDLQARREFYSMLLSAAEEAIDPAGRA